MQADQQVLSHLAVQAFTSPLMSCRHTSRFLVIWLCFLPFTLWRACHWVMVPAAVTIAFLLLGVEEIGVQIEEPFGILPLGQSPACSHLLCPPWCPFCSFHFLAHCGNPCISPKLCCLTTLMCFCDRLQAISDDLFQCMVPGCGKYHITDCLVAAAPVANQFKL